MVIGNDKEEKIGREPLLKVYFDFFKDVIWGGGVKMVVIGYGFRDRHINEVLTRGIEKHGLKLYVVMPKSFQEFKIPLYDSRYEAEGIIDGIRGYYPVSLKDIFPRGSTSVIYQELATALLSS